MDWRIHGLVDFLSASTARIHQSTNPSIHQPSRMRDTRLRPLFEVEYSHLFPTTTTRRQPEMRQKTVYVLAIVVIMAIVFSMAAAAAQGPPAGGGQGRGGGPGGGGGGGGAQRGGRGGGGPGFTLTSTSWSDGGEIPVKYAGA